MLEAPPLPPCAIGPGNPDDPGGSDDYESPQSYRPKIRWKLRYLPPGSDKVCRRHCFAHDPDDAVGHFLPEGARLVSCKPSPK